MNISQVAERHSTRPTARPAIMMLSESLGDDMQVDSEFEQNLTESSSRGKKRKSCEDRVNPQIKKFRGKRGLLEQLFEMPLDVLFVPLPTRVRTVLISKTQFDFVQASLGSISFRLFRQNGIYICNVSQYFIYAL